MALWTKPPRSAYELLIEYLNDNYPNEPMSIACDLDNKLIHLDMPNLSDTDLDGLMVTLQANFPGAF
jgi:hypothetical protein